MGLDANFIVKYVDSESDIDKSGYEVGYERNCWVFNTYVITRFKSNEDYNYKLTLNDLCDYLKLVADIIQSYKTMSEDEFEHYARISLPWYPPDRPVEHPYGDNYMYECMQSVEFIGMLFSEVRSYPFDFEIYYSASW